jgi:hypothetical protein
MDLGCCCCWADGSMSFCDQGWTGKAGKASYSSRYSIFLSGQPQFDHVKPWIFPWNSGKFSCFQVTPVATWSSWESENLTTSKVFRDFMTFHDISWPALGMFGIPSSSMIYTISLDMDQTLWAEWAEVMAVTLAMLYHGASTRRPLPSALGRTNRAGGVGGAGWAGFFFGLICHHSLQLAARIDLSRLEMEMEMMCHHKLRHRTWDSTFFWSSWVLLGSFSAFRKWALAAGESHLFVQEWGIPKILWFINSSTLIPTFFSTFHNCCWSLKISKSCTRFLFIDLHCYLSWTPTTCLVE